MIFSGSLIAVAAATAFVLTLGGCKKPAPPVEKPKLTVGVTVEIQVFGMPRVPAAETVLSCGFS